MARLLLTGTFVAATLIATALPAFAGGAFDFLDPCIKARDQFHDQRQAIIAHYASAEQVNVTASAPQEFRDLWMMAKRAEMRATFDADETPRQRAMGTPDMDRAYSVWFDELIANVEPNQLTDIINQNYRELVKEEIARTRSQSEAEFASVKSELDASCKKDVGSQTLRLVMAPIGWVARNFEAGKSEKNVVTQVVRAVTGISPKDIAKHGLLGGENSELRKAANAVAGGPNGEFRKALRFMDPGNHEGIFGGPNSFFRKPFG